MSVYLRLDLGSGELRPLYPMWDRFLEHRRRFDPHGVFLTPDMMHLFGDTPDRAPHGLAAGRRQAAAS